ncbi:unnamed protein product [Rhizophagus irregularis]|uniref:Uncharacterized protein n=1 Tax=Rhizophagus irregularis TaxID=588596 RepID=A0A915ZDG6_9GLOM|nr:unnamed protein product [Rhizophagus irregularis]
MIKILNSDVLVSSADTIKNDILESFKVEQKKMSKLFQILAVTSDNASNNLTFMKYLENTCQRENISFDAINSHFQCLAHIINLVVQEILKQVKASEAQTEDDIMDNMDSTINAGDSQTYSKSKIITTMPRKAIDAMANSDKDLRNFEITDDEWNKIKEIISVLKIFV